MKNYKLYFILFLCFISCTSDIPYSPKNIDFSSNSTIKIITFNIRTDSFFGFWNNRKEKISEILYNQKADIICFQEGLFHQIDYLSKTFPQYNYYFIGRNDGKKKGESCSIFYNKNKFVLLEKGTFWFSDFPDKAGSKTWPSFWPRICSWIKLKDNSTNKVFYIYNLHLNIIFSSTHKKSIDLLSKKTNFPCIITGDFNMKLNEFPNYFLEKFDYKNIDKNSLDHLFCSKDIILIETKKDNSFNKNYPSDHKALISVLKL